MERIGHIHKPSGGVFKVFPADKYKFRLAQVRNLVGVMRNEDLMFCCVGDRCVIVSLVAETFRGNELNIDATVMLNREGICMMVYGDVLIIKNELLNINHDSTSGKKVKMPFTRASKTNFNLLSKKEKTT